MVGFVVFVGLVGWLVGWLVLVGLLLDPLLVAVLLQLLVSQVSLERHYLFVFLLQYLNQLA